MEEVTASQMIDAIRDLNDLISEFIASEIRPKITRYSDGRIRINKPFSFSKDEAGHITDLFGMLKAREPGLCDPLDSYWARKN